MSEQLSNEAMKRLEQLLGAHERGEMDTLHVAFELGRLHGRVNVKAQAAINRWCLRQVDDGR